MVQYDLTAGGGELEEINASMVQLLSTDGPAYINGKGLQLGPDGKIYTLDKGDLGKLAVINNPNAAGTACDYQAEAISLGQGYGSYTLPSFIAGFDYDNTVISCIYVGMEELSDIEISVSPNPAVSHIEIRSGALLNNCNLTLVNSNGKVVLEEYQSSGDVIQVDVSQLAAGVYVLQLWEDQRILTPSKKLAIKK